MTSLPLRIAKRRSLLGGPEGFPTVAARFPNQSVTRSSPISVLTFCSTKLLRASISPDRLAKSWISAESFWTRANSEAKTFSSARLIRFFTGSRSTTRMKIITPSVTADGSISRCSRNPLSRRMKFR